jgi:phage gpG-like protein
MAKPTVKIKGEAKKALAALEKINIEFSKGSDRVKIGLPKGSNNYPDGTSVIMVGAVHEFGSPSRGIPERSYLRTSLSDNRAKYKGLFRKLSSQIVDGVRSKLEALQIIGLSAQQDVFAKITDIKTPELLHREGNPLVDTGHLRQSITFIVED